MTFEDRAISGAGAINRPGFQALMRAAQASSMLMLARTWNRLFRDQADYHNSRKHLDHFGIAIHTAGGGKVGKLDGALRALMSEMFLENLAVHSRRGMEGVIHDGRHAGGRAYGYRAVIGKPGELEIVEEEAEVIRRIFGEYIAGRTPRQIAHDLNKRGISPARSPMERIDRQRQCFARRWPDHE